MLNSEKGKGGGNMPFFWCRKTVGRKGEEVEPANYIQVFKKKGGASGLVF